MLGDKDRRRNTRYLVEGEGEPVSNRGEVGCRRPSEILRIWRRKVLIDSVLLAPRHVELRSGQSTRRPSDQ